MLNVGELPQKGELFDGRYKLLRTLSTDGATADVWLAIDANTIDTGYDEDGSIANGNADETGMLVAIKIYRPKNALDIEGEQRFRDEFKIVYECRHENLLQPTSFAICKDIPYLVLPYCKNGSSEQLIGKKQTEEEIWKFISDVASGLAKLHSNQPQIIHQDIKPANILIDNGHNFAITDFGISSKNSSSYDSHNDDENSGTFAYMAPERFEDNPTPTAESDIWALGATLCEILTGKVPFGEEGGKSQDENTPMPVLSGLPTSIKNLIYACLQKDPKRRPTARQIMQAAQTKQYPKKRKTALYISLGILGCLFIGVAIYFLKKNVPVDEPSIPQKTVEKTFKLALAQMDTDNTDTMKAGIHLMDSLSKTDYVPALYQMAYTYGWYTDPGSIQRKKLLDIKTDTNNFPTVPIDIDNTKVWLNKIIEIGDSSYAFYNADAAFRLGSYYTDKRFKDNRGKNELENYNTALNYYYQAEGWAKVAKDTVLLENIGKGKELAIRKIKQQQPKANSK